ncbi:hypothetical protein A9Q99_01030 [Gammaproteobacteria bacterium 45_16_T64]|nr:hypothetical protein A9Q99_01030 [Gammaproteobacteria bacterium 45_16_T64]
MTDVGSKTINETSPAAVPYWSLSGFYFFYFSLLGALLPYWGLYLKDEGFSPIEIGQLMAILMGTKIIAPNIWGYLADKTGRRVRIIRWGAALTTVFFSTIFFQPDFWGYAFLVASFTFFWNAILPQFEVVTLNSLQDRQHEYSRIRVWGSIGFVFTVVGFGWVFDVSSVGMLPYYLVTMMALIWLSSLFVAEPPAVPIKKKEETSFLHQLNRGPVIVFFIVCFLMQVSHGPYYSFYSIFMEESGYSKVAIGWLWAIGVIAEILIFMVMHKLMDRYSSAFLLAFSLALGALRWLLTALYPEQVVLVVFSQICHAATFGVFHAVAIHWVQHHFSARSSGQAQAFYSALSFGGGGAVGSFLAGIMWEDFGGESSFYIASLACGLGAILAWFKLPKAVV